VRAHTCMRSHRCVRANSHRAARTHPRMYTRTHAHNADNRTCAPAIYKLYARCNRSYKQFNYVYASEITRLSMNGITTWRPDRSLGYRVIARSDNKIGYLSRTRARVCDSLEILNRRAFTYTRCANWHKCAATRARARALYISRNKSMRCTFDHHILRASA